MIWTLPPHTVLLLSCVLSVRLVDGLGLLRCLKPHLLHLLVKQVELTLVSLIVLFDAHRILLWAVLHRLLEELHDGVHSLKAVLAAEVFDLLYYFVFGFVMPVLNDHFFRRRGRNVRHL